MIPESRVTCTLEDPSTAWPMPPATSPPNLQGAGRLARATQSREFLTVAWMLEAQLRVGRVVQATLTQIQLVMEFLGITIQATLAKAMPGCLRILITGTMVVQNFARTKGFDRETKFEWACGAMKLAPQGVTC